jgi:hypothetical protein
MADAEQAPGNGTRSPTKSEERSDKFRIAEFKALREEIVKRLELESQVIYLLLFSAGTILAIGVQGLTKPSTSNSDSTSLVSIALFMFPLVAFFLAATWAQHDLRIGQIRSYIRTRVEPDQSGWESYRKAFNVSARVLNIRVGTLGARGAFLAAQVASLALALSYYSISLDWNFLGSANVLQEVLTIADVIAVVLTVFLVRRRRPQRAL